MVLIHDLFFEAVKRYSDKNAIVFRDEFITYFELNELSNQIANRLILNGIKENDIVGICKHRSINTIATMIAILKVGASYLPLDPLYPEDRLRFMLEQSQAKKLIIDEELKQIFKTSSSDIFLTTDRLTEEKSFQSNRNADLAYVIYTSGSTGKPKGVAMGHTPLVNLINWQNKETSLLDRSITLQFTPISFDVHFQEIFSTLSLGGTLVLITEEMRLNTLKLIEEINAKKVNRMYLPFVALNHIAETAAKYQVFPKYLKEITTAGEQLKITKDIRLMVERLEDCALFNHYGPSETHVVTSKKLSGNPNNWPDLPSIGSEIDHCQIRLLDHNFLEVKDGEVGELYIFGKVLANGYLNSNEQTNERFIKTEWGLCYKTGDLGKRIKKDIEFLGRSDSQVKIRGYRIEPAEIEIEISKILNGKKALVKPILETNIETYLCAYFLNADKVDLDYLKIQLKLILPDYMLPRSYMQVDKFPMTPSGKVDYKNLPKPKLVRPHLENEYVSATNETEEIILSIWKELLRLDEIGVEDSFFDLGGNSLSAIKMLMEINNTFKSELSITHIFSLRSIKKIAGKILNHEEEEQYLKKDSHNIGDGKIAIIAMNGKFPGAENLDEYWKNLESVKSSIEFFQKTEVHSLVSKEKINNPDYVFCKGEIQGQEYFDHKFFQINPKEADFTDPQQRKFLELCYEALELAGISPLKFKGEIGVFAGMGNSKYSLLIDQHPEDKNLVGEFNVMLGLEKDYIATKVSYKLNLKGPAISIHTACSTSLVAIIEAVQNLRLNNCDVALAGGIAISGLKNQGHLFLEGGILSKDGNCRPYDNEATGTIFTDGAGVVVLKRLSDAIKDQDNIIAVISGVGINNDGADKTSFTAPSVEGQKKAILKAMADAGVSADEIGMIEGHGTATPVGDPIEVDALTSAFNKSTKRKNFCTLTSLKSNVGHLTAAAGVASIIKTAFALKNKKIPGTCHFKNYNKFIDFSLTPFIVKNETSDFLPNASGKRIAGVSSFGVGGTNAHIILEDYERNVPIEIKDKIHLLKISTKNQNALDELKINAKKSILVNSDHLGKLAYTLDLGRNDYQFRSCFIATNTNLNESIDEVSNNGEKLKNLIFGFPGQGSHYAKMAKNLFQHNEVFKNNLTQLNDKIIKYTNLDVVELMWRDDSEELLSQTKFSQPAIFLVQLSIAKTYRQLGVKPQVLIGHSIGEFAASVIAEIFDEDSAIKMIIKRAELMQSLDTGKMLSVNLEIKEALEIKKKFNVDIAAINSEKSVVLSGETVKINEVKKYLDANNLASIELKTSHAFHSKMMKGMIKEFSKTVETIQFLRPKINIIKTSKSENEIWEKDYWTQHVLESVDFFGAQKHLEKFDQSAFVEIGSKNILSSYLKKNNRLNLKYFMSLGSKQDLESSSFMKSMASFWVFGIYQHSFEWNYSESEKFKTIGPTYPFEKNYHWLDIQTNKEEIMSTDENLQLKMKLAKIFEETSGIEINSSDYQTSFLELGMDSLFLTQISMQLKKELKVTVGFRQLLENFDNIDLLATHLKDQVKIPGTSQVVKTEEKIVVQEIAIPQVPKNETLHTTQVNSAVTKPLVTTVKTRELPVQLLNQSLPAKNLVDLVSKQLDLMQQQIQLLAGQDIQIHSNFEKVESEEVKIQVSSNSPIVQEASTEEKNQRGADIKKAKDSFGAQAKIVVEKTSTLDDQTLKKIKDFSLAYNQKTRSSKNFAQENRINHADPRVVTGFKPESKEVVYPIVVKKSYLQTLWDLDDNKYIDMTCGFGSNFFGNGNERIKKLVLKQIEDGIEIGPQHPLVSEVSKLINELTGNERSAFCNTGSEAVLGAMRLARTVTGREKIIVFSGSYHGINDEVIIRGSKNLNSIPAAPGINFGAVSNMIVLDYGTDEALEYIRQNADDVAAVLVEPVQSRRSDFHPKEFLKEVRKITENSKTCLIFDEIITGFRIHPAGAQGHFGIRADLCTYGKIVGGGMPIGVISGKTEYMDALDGGFWQYGDDSTPTVGVTYFAGTFVRHPLALAAAKGALEILRDGGQDLFNQLNERAQKFADEINYLLKSNNIPLKMDNFGSLMKPKWIKEIPSGDLFFVALRFNGVHAYDGFPWFVNLAHSKEELEQVIISFKKSIEMMQEVGIFEKKKNIDLELNKIIAHGPMIPGAKLGKDEQGNPAWFVEDPNHPGEYFKVKK